MPSATCESCSKPVDPDSPDVERGGHLICLDCQSDILASSLAWVNNRRGTVKEIDNGRWVRAEWMRKYLEDKGEAVPDELREFTDHFRQQKADDDAADARRWPWERDGHGLEKWVLY